jgi:hypothetical protein
VRARTACVVFDGSFMPEPKKQEFYREDFERYGWRLGASGTAAHASDATFLSVQG